MRLDRSRMPGFSGPNPIAVSDIVALATIMGIDDVDERLSFLDRIQVMDSAFLVEYYRTKKQPNRKQK